MADSRELMADSFTELEVTSMRSLSFGLTAAGLAVVVVAAGQTPAGPGGGGRAGGAPAAQAPTDPTVVGRTPEGFTLRLARKTNHILELQRVGRGVLHAARSAHHVRRPAGQDRRGLESAPRGES